jgi:hypothetical protein
MDFDNKQARIALIAMLAAVGLSPSMLHAQTEQGLQCTPEYKSSLEIYAKTIRKFKQIGSDQLRLVCSVVEAGEAGESTALGQRLDKLDEFAKDANPVLKKWLGITIPEDLKSKIDMAAATKYCHDQKGKAESYIEDEEKRIDAELARCGISI